jgi:hypothetical protein
VEEKRPSKAQQVKKKITTKINHANDTFKQTRELLTWFGGKQSKITMFKIVVTIIWLMMVIVFSFRFMQMN